uniref:Uncharacterized protein n=1 Tax=Mesocestoides corti TaxID=53468 RepID=A0A5K3FHQ3_MESCO
MSKLKKTGLPSLQLIPQLTYYTPMPCLLSLISSSSSGVEDGIKRDTVLR